MEIGACRVSPGQMVQTVSVDVGDAEAVEKAMGEAVGKQGAVQARVKDARPSRTTRCCCVGVDNKTLCHTSEESLRLLSCVHWRRQRDTPAQQKARQITVSQRHACGAC